MPETEGDRVRVREKILALEMKEGAMSQGVQGM